MTIYNNKAYLNYSFRVIKYCFYFLWLLELVFWLNFALLIIISLVIVNLVHFIWYAICSYNCQFLVHTNSLHIQGVVTSYFGANMERYTQFKTTRDASSHPFGEPCVLDLLSYGDKILSLQNDTLKCNYKKGRCAYEIKLFSLMLPWPFIKIYFFIVN